MAASIREPVLYGPPNEEHVANFHRVMELVVVCGSRTLQKYLEKCLSDKGKTLADHVSENDIIRREGRNLSDEQRNILLTSSLHLCDNTLCRILFKYLNQRFPSDIWDAMDRLRKLRNKLAHTVKCEIHGTVDFNEGERDILKIASEIGSEFRATVARKINEVRSQKIVRIASPSELLNLVGELLMCKLEDYSEGCGKMLCSVCNNML